MKKLFALMALSGMLFFMRLKKQQRRQKQDNHCTAS